MWASPDCTTYSIAAISHHRKQDEHGNLVPVSDEEIANMEIVVRCKECDMSEVYQSDSNGVMARYCKAFTPTRMIADDDFCSYGERKSK